MSKMTVEYKEKHHILEVDGVEYEVPQRTAELEKKIREHDKNIFKMSEYESNISMLEILFGEKNTNKMFPDEKNTNLDKLALCTRMAIALYMTELHNIEAEDFGSKIK